MNNQTLTINNYQYPITNPTKYSPDAVIGKYCVAHQTTAEQLVKKELDNGVSLQVANQNLFVRAVRHEESKNYANMLILINLAYVFIKDVADNQPLGAVVLNFVLNYYITGFFIGLAYEIITAITDRLGLDIQYSV